MRDALISRRGAAAALLASLAGPVLLAGCATPTQPLSVSVIRVDRVAEAAPELRFHAQLRLLNANHAPVSYQGASAQLRLLNGAVIGQGVTSAQGSVPALGEAVLELPIVITQVGELRRALGLYAAPDRRIDVVLRGELAGAAAAASRFEWRSELALPLPR